MIIFAIMLHTGIHGHSVLGLASQLIAQAGSIAGLASWQPEDFRRLKGIGQAKGRQLAALIEIGRRMIKQPTGEAPMLNRPELIAAYMAPYIRGLEVEKFWVLCLNRKNRLKKLVEVTSGTATSALAHPREVFRSAVQHGATAIAWRESQTLGTPRRPKSVVNKCDSKQFRTGIGKSSVGAAGRSNTSKAQRLGHFST